MRNTSRQYNTAGNLNLPETIKGKERSNFDPIIEF